MSQKLLSPGQKRRRRITLFVILAAIAVLGLISQLPGFGQKEAQALEADHQSAIITVTSAEEVTEEYTNWKGKTSTRDLQYLSYTFEAEGQTFTVDQEEVGTLVYTLAEAEQPIEVWFPAGQPDDHQFAVMVRGKAHSKPLTRAIAALIYVVPAAIFVRMVLLFLFGREPKGTLPEGFYTANSWLDIEDHSLVMISDGQIRSLDFNKKKVDDIRKLYQNNGSFEQMLAAANGELTTVAIDSITALSSSHYSDTISIEYKVGDKEESLSLEFLNATVKEHALAAIEGVLPATLTKTVEHKTRWQSVRAATVIALVLMGAIYYFNNKWVFAVGVVLLFLTIKSILPRLWDPAIETNWEQPKAEPAVS